MEEDETTVIVSLAAVRLQSKSRLFQMACCPDKDLVVLLSKSTTTTDERLSLWKLQGSKKWEVDLNKGAGGSSTVAEEVTALNWSPDGQLIVIGYYPCRVGLHSLQNGREERSLAIESPAIPVSPSPRINGLWWFKREVHEDKAKMPDIFKRGDVITGSALSILRSQPLLDPLQEDSLSLDATDLFAFQGRQSKQIKTNTIPTVISSWPALPPDPLVASIKPSSHEGQPGEELDEKDTSSVNSILAATDDSGRVHCFLDGTYPLGAISLGVRAQVTSLVKKGDEPTLLVHAKMAVGGAEEESRFITTLVPFTIHLPILFDKATRNVAEVSSAARELALYAIRVVKEMRRAWFGEEGEEGARAISQTYIRGLEERQRVQEQETNAVFDLTVLLAIGKPSPALSDFNSTSDLTSERGLQKWQSTVSEALLKLRDYAEKRLGPACQRLHLLLEEVRGWSLLPQLYGHFEFSTKEVDACLDLAARGIILSAWLAAAARSELSRFNEFIQFLFYETTRAEGTAPPIPRFDMLKVSEYLTSGLVVSCIDKWFLGPVPTFRPESIGPEPGPESQPHSDEDEDLHHAIEEARKLALDEDRLSWPPITERKDLTHLERNLDGLVHALGDKCQRTFDRAAKAVSRTGTCRGGGVGFELEGLESESDSGGWIGKLTRRELLIRMQVVCEEKGGRLRQYTAVRVRGGEDGTPPGSNFLCMIESLCGHAKGTWMASEVGVAVIECRGEGEEREGERLPVEVVDMDFFDEERLAVVYRGQGRSWIGLVRHRDRVEYRRVLSDAEGGPDADMKWIEAVVVRGMEAVRAGQMEAVPMVIERCRPLQLQLQLSATEKARSPTAEVRSMLAVNGRPGRRVSCVLSEAGTEIEMLDMEAVEEGDGGEE